jgi:hypothetical protein
MRRFSSAVVSSRLAEMRSIADSLIKDEQWSSAVGPLEALRASATPASREWKVLLLVVLCATSFLFLFKKKKIFFISELLLSLRCACSLKTVATRQESCTSLL